jgi:hypothetical protein
MTNLDRIRQMSAEELAEWIAGYDTEISFEQYEHGFEIAVHRYYELSYSKQGETAKDCALRWLTAEAKEGQG